MANQSIQTEGQRNGGVQTGLCEHYTHEVVPLTEIVLVRVPKPTHRGLHGGKRWHKFDAVFIKCVWVGRSDLSDEHIVLTPGGRVFSRTIRRLEPSRRHDAGFLDKVKGLPWDAKDGIVRFRPRKEPAPPTIVVGESPERKKVRFLPNSGDGGVAAVTVEELVEDYWSDEHGQGQMFEVLHCKVEPDLDTINTEAALDRLLENGVVRDIPRAFQELKVLA